MDNKIEISSLLDIYGSILTEHQRKLLEMYANDDFSLAEIAENESISRQGARDAIVRAKHQLYDFEAKLGVMRWRAALLTAIDELETVLDADDKPDAAELAAKVSRIRGIAEEADGI